MKKILLFATVSLLGVSLNAADSSPKDDISGAGKKLADTSNYSWHTTIVVPDDAPFRPGPIDGKTEKGGFTTLKMSFFDNATEIVMQGDKAAVHGAEAGWQSVADLEKDGEGPGQFLAMVVRNTKTPAAQAAELVSYAKEFKKDGDVWVSDLTEEGTKKLLTFRPRKGEPEATVTNAKGSVKFWLKDGALLKYEYKLKGSVNFNGNEFDSDRTITVEIKDVGTTKIVVPDEAKKSLS